MSAGAGNVLLRVVAVLSLVVALTLLVMLPAVFVSPSEVTAHDEMTFRLGPGDVEARRVPAHSIGDILSGEYRCARNEEHGLVLVVSNRSALVEWAEGLLDGESPVHAAKRAGSGVLYDTEGASGSFEFRLSDERFMVGLFNPGEQNVTVEVDLRVSSEPDYICLCFVAPMAAMALVAIWAMGRGTRATGPNGRDNRGDEWLTRYGMADDRHPRTAQEERQIRRGQREEDRERRGGRGRWEENEGVRSGQAECPGGDRWHPPHVPPHPDDHGRSRHMPPPPDELGRPPYGPPTDDHERPRYMPPPLDDNGRPQYMPPPPDAFYPCLRCGERLVPDGWGGWYCPRCDARY